MGQNSAGDAGTRRASAPDAVVLVVAGDPRRAGRLASAMSERGLRVAVFDPGQSGEEASVGAVEEMVAELLSRPSDRPESPQGPPPRIGR